jgi:hydroxyacylglutathione hydrolase
VQHLAGHGAIVLDTRANVAFGGAYVLGAINVALGAIFATWVGWLVPADTPLVLVLDREDDWVEATTALLRIGYERFAGYAQFGMAAWVEAGLPVARVEQLSVHELQRRLAERPDVQVLDVRMDSEWAEGHIERAVHAPLGDLPGLLDGLPLDRGRAVAAVCGSGYRSSIATSLLKQQGFETVWNTLGGMTAWKEVGLPTVKGEKAAGWRAEELRVRDEGQHLVRRAAALTK